MTLCCCLQNITDELQSNKAVIDALHEQAGSLGEQVRSALPGEFCVLSQRGRAGDIHLDEDTYVFFASLGDQVIFTLTETLLCCLQAWTNR